MPLERADCGPGVKLQLQAAVLDLPDVGDVVREPREVWHRFVVQEVACDLVVGVRSETDAVVEQAEVEARVVLGGGLPAQVGVWIATDGSSVAVRREAERVGRAHAPRRERLIWADRLASRLAGAD